MNEPHSPEPGPKWAERHLTAAFHRTVLARYKCSLDLYAVDEDDCGGWLKRRSDIDDPDVPSGEPQFFELRYGFRHLADGRICVVAWLPDIERLPTREQDAWMVDALREPAFAETDSTYKRWCARTLDGEWNDAGPLEELRSQLGRVRAISQVAMGSELFSSSDSPLLHYPAAENSAELLASLSELHRLVIDGLNESQVRRWALDRGALATEEFKKLRGLGLLKTLLPPDLVPRIHKPLLDLRTSRNALHRNPAPPPIAMGAFDEFLRTAASVASAISELREFLLTQFAVDEEACVRRIEIMESRAFPSVVPLEHGHPDAGRLQQANNKTIERIEVGGAGGMDFGFRRDVIALHFTDGSSLVIAPMPNVGNWEDRVPEFRRADLSVHLDATFVPSGWQKDEQATSRPLPDSPTDP